MTNKHPPTIELSSPRVVALNYQGKRIASDEYEIAQVILQPYKKIVISESQFPITIAAYEQQASIQTDVVLEIRPPDDFGIAGFPQTSDPYNCYHGDALFEYKRAPSQRILISNSVVKNRPFVLWTTDEKTDLREVWEAKELAAGRERYFVAIDEIAHAEQLGIEEVIIMRIWNSITPPNGYTARYDCFIMDSNIIDLVLQQIPHSNGEVIKRFIDSLVSKGYLVENDALHNYRYVPTKLGRDWLIEQIKEKEVTK